MTAHDRHVMEHRPQAGQDPEAGMAAIVQRHKDFLVDFLFQMTGSKDLAIELALQIAVMRGRPKTLVLARTDPRRWLLKVATSRVLSMERGRGLLPPWKRRRPQRPLFEKGVTPGGGVPSWERMEEERVLRAALGAVGPRLRRLLVLRDLLGIPTEEAAQLSGLTHQEFQARLERARAGLTSALAAIREG